MLPAALPDRAGSPTVVLTHGASFLTHEPLVPSCAARSSIDVLTSCSGARLRAAARACVVGVAPPGLGVCVVARPTRASRHAACSGSVPGRGARGGGGVGRLLLLEIAENYGELRRDDGGSERGLEVHALERWCGAGRESARAVVGVVCGLCVCHLFARRDGAGGCDETAVSRARDPPTAFADRGLKMVREVCGTNTALDRRKPPTGLERRTSRSARVASRRHLEMCVAIINVC